MKPIWLAASAVALLAACVPPAGEDATFAENCAYVFDDAELRSEMQNASIQPDDACSCLEARIADDPNTKEKVELFFEMVAAKMADGELGAEDAAGALVGDAMVPSDEEAEGPSFADTLPVFNQVFEPMMDEMEENGGACPAAATPE